MTGQSLACPQCGHWDLDPRRILVGALGRSVAGSSLAKLQAQEIITLKCQSCGWLGECLATSR
jgi:hypothetical protein